MHRFYALSLDESRTAVLAPEDARHAATVLRLKADDMVEIIWDHHRYAARLTACSPKEASAVLVRQLPDTEPTLRLTLFQGLPKADKMDLIVQKAVELGVHQVVPVLMERSIVRPDEAGMRKKQERWQKIAREACKQSGRTDDMEVALPVPLPSLNETFASLDAVAVPWEEAGAVSLRSWQSAHASAASIGVLIGPEGGISPSEIEFLQSAGAQSVTLGPRILRTETAGLCAISCLMLLYGEMELPPVRMEVTHA